MTLNLDIKETLKNKHINSSDDLVNTRWSNIKRLYDENDVKKLSGSVKIEYSLAKQGAEKLWKYLNEDEIQSRLYRRSRSPIQVDFRYYI